MRSPEDVLQAQLDMASPPAGYELVQALQAAGWTLVSTKRYAEMVDEIAMPRDVTKVIRNNLFGPGGFWHNPNAEVGPDE
jgi:hypothetical protein